MPLVPHSLEWHRQALTRKANQVVLARETARAAQETADKLRLELDDYAGQLVAAETNGRSAFERKAMGEPNMSHDGVIVKYWCRFCKSYHVYSKIPEVRKGLGCEDPT